MLKIGIVGAMALTLVLSGQVVAEAASSRLVGSRAKLARIADRSSVTVPAVEGAERSNALLWVLAATGVAVTLGLVSGSGGSDAPKSP